MAEGKVYGGRFTVVSEIVERLTCKVYVATDNSLGDKQVALKVFNTTASEAKDAELQEQLKPLRSASHPALAPIIAGGIEGSEAYIAMELVDGLTLEQTMQDAGGPLEIEQAVQIVNEIGEGLDEIRSSGAAHGHLDSRAVIFRGKDVRLCGYCPPVIDELAGGDAFPAMVDPYFVAPEQLEGKSADARTDVYQLAILFYWMITGEMPFKGDSPQAIASARTAGLPTAPNKLNNNVSALVDAAVLKALSINPNERFRNCGEFIDAASGGKKPIKNPLEGMDEEAERLGGSTQTIAVSMSTDVLKQMLGSGAGAGAAAGASQAVASATSSGSSAGSSKPAVNGGGVNGGAEPAEEMDVASTVMGMQSSALLSGSMVFLKGAQKGKKVMLDKAQAMIGSDRGCDIVVNEKGLPPRYAIIVRRGEDYFVGPLSPEPLVINGESVEGGSEQKLNRGDVISAGKVQLRFVAPGEVFTLQSNVADRVIDRPKSRMPLYFTAAIAVVAAIAGTAIYMHQGAFEDAQARKARETRLQAQEREKLIATLLKEGDEFYKDEQYIEPIGDSARDRFQNVLDLDPSNAYAKRRIAEIESRIEQIRANRARARETEQRVAQLLDDANNYFEDGDYVAPPGRNAKEAYERILKFDPDNEVASKRIQEIDGILADLLNRVEVWLSKASVYASLGQYVRPEPESAYRYLQQVLKVDPENERAQEMVLDMAAQSIFRGDEAKRTGDVDTLEQEYEIALALGTNPDFISPRQQGLDLIRRSRGRVILPPVEFDFPALRETDKAGGFLNSQDLQRRVKALGLKSTRSKRDQRVWDIGS